MNTTVRIATRQKLTEFLEDHDYLVEVMDEKILAVKTVGGPTVYIARERFSGQWETEATLYFELSLGALDGLEQNAGILFQLLDLNSEIAPVSVAINSENDRPELCLVERLEEKNLDSNEVLSVLESMGLACLKIQQLLG